MGDGKSISIWGEYWLPFKENGKIITSPFPFLEQAKADSLMCQDDKNWDREVINEIFESRYANLILSSLIPSVPRK